MSGDTLAVQVEALACLDLDGLRQVWRQRKGMRSAIRSRDLLRRMLAFDLQAEAYGGLDADLRQRLRRAATAVPKKARLQPGTAITRDWHGERHVVQVTERGFTHNGVSYASLSEIARTITGARWSGPRFFGLTEPGKTR